MKKMYLVPIIVVLGLLIAWFTFGGKKTQAPAALETSKATSSSGSSQAVATNAVGISDMQFTPVTIQVPVGTTVHWSNNDSMAHTVTADDGSFNSGSLAKDASFTHLFNKAGTYKYHCAFHSSMTGTVIVR